MYDPVFKSYIVRTTYKQQAGFFRINTIKRFENVNENSLFHQDILQNDDIKLDTMFKFSIAIDISKVCIL